MHIAVMLDYLLLIINISNSFTGFRTLQYITLLHIKVIYSALVYKTTVLIHQ